MEHPSLAFDSTLREMWTVLSENTLGETRGPDNFGSQCLVAGKVWRWHETSANKNHVLSKFNLSSTYQFGPQVPTGKCVQHLAVLNSLCNSTVSTYNNAFSPSPNECQTRPVLHLPGRQHHALLSKLLRFNYLSFFFSLLDDVSMPLQCARYSL